MGFRATVRETKVFTMFLNASATPDICRFESKFSARWLFIAIALTAFFMGSRAIYRVFEVANISFAAIVLVRIGPQYLGHHFLPGLQVTR